MSEAPRSRAWWFPALAEQVDLDRGVDLRPGGGPLVVLDGVDAGAVTDRLPPGAALVSDLGAAEELRDVVRTENRDVVLVSEADALTAYVHAALAMGLASDSACATVSFDPQASWAGAELPPPAVDAPRRGVVLVRRDHLLLALDDVELLSAEDVALIDVPTGRGAVADVLRCLVRPGLVHRACPGPAPVRARVPVAGRTGGKPFDAQVVIDGRCLEFPLSGSQAHLIGLLGGLVRAGADVAVLAPDELHPSTAAALGGLRESVPFVERAKVGPAAVFHRPFQIGSLEGLAECLSIGDRLVVTHQDMIAVRTPAYAPNTASWERLRTATEAVLTSADQLTFFSRHAALDAASDGYLDTTRATVVPLGVDHLRSAAEPRRAAAPLHGRPYLLVLGNSYWHKNRLHAVRLLRWLVERHGWDGGLVLAGGHPEPGSSRAAEAAFIRAAPALEGRVIDLGHVPDDERVDLYAGCELVLCPSLLEGFGLVPFEAAALGTAATYAHLASMRELLPGAGALPSFDVEDAGHFVLGLLESVPAREAVVSAIVEAARDLTWDRAAAGYLEVYGRALERPERPVSRALLSVCPGGALRLTSKEELVVAVHRRRRAFRVAFDLAGAGAALLRQVRGDARSGDGEDGVEERPR